MDRELAYLVFTDEATFYEGPIRNRRWIAPNQSYDISAVKSNIKINVWRAICYSGKIDIHFNKEKRNSDIYINILKRYQMFSDLAPVFVQSFDHAFDRSNIEALRSEPIWSKNGPLWLEKARAKS